MNWKVKNMEIGEVYKLAIERVEEFIERQDPEKLAKELNEMYNEKVRELEEELGEDLGLIAFYRIDAGDINLGRGELYLRSAVLDTIETLYTDDGIEPERIAEKLDEIIELRWGVLKELTVYNLIGSFRAVEDKKEHLEESYLDAVRILFQ